MKKRTIFQFIAILISSLTSILHAQTTTEDTSKKERKGETAAKHHRKHNGGSKATQEASDDPPRHNHHSDISAAGGDDIKNSKNAASWSPAQDQDAPPLKLDPSVMAGAEPSVSTVTPASIASAPAPIPGEEVSRYPWKRQIVTTTFWVGENSSKNNPVPNRASCWDPHWSSNYGGSDEPDASRRNADYIPASFVPGQNPFYVALPYNDMEHGAHKAEASGIIPWFSKEYKGPTKSVCKGRWLAIRHGNKVCYAQWEDAGPFRTDHWEYVFGNARPKPNLNQGAGLDVSPAVRDYLGMTGMDVTDWKFVDFDEVPSGPWAKFGSNNTFVQNSQNTSTEVAQAKAQRPVSIRDLIAPGVAGLGIGGVVGDQEIR